MNLLWFNLATDRDDSVLGFTSKWISAMAQRVQTIQVVTMRSGRLELPPNVRVFSVGLEKGYSEVRRGLEFYRILWGILHEGKVDACFSHMMPLFSAMAGPWLRVRGIPLVTWYAHPSVTPKLRVAHFFSDRMVASVPGAYPYKHDKLTVVGQGIDTALFSPNGIEPEEPMVLCAGRLSPSKNHLTLLDAFSRVQTQWNKVVKLVILGSPAGEAAEEYGRSLKDHARELGIAEAVVFHPGVPITELPEWYRRCTVHVNLTPVGFGDKVAWEPMACGRPSIVSNTDFAEMLGIYADRLMFRLKDAEDLSDKILGILSLSKKQQKEIGLYLREQVIRFHSLERLSDVLLKMMTELRQGRRKSNGAH
jgi:glycosyltransferase involved in cell wall biosynthesis